MKISVIIPYTTGLEMLRDCFESLAEQTYQDFEVVLVQDQIPAEICKDRNVTTIESPKALIEEFKETFPITYLISQTNIGVGACRNLGIKHATGEYVYFLDMDDYLFENTFEKLILKEELLVDDISLDLIHGKQISTWYKRKVYLELQKEKLRKKEEARLANQESESSEEEPDEISVDIAEESEESDSLESSNDHESSEDTEESEEGTEESDEDSEESLELTEEELELRRLRKFRLTQNVFVQNRMKGRKGINSISALHILIRRELLISNDIFFDETLKKYADLVFVAKLLSCAEHIRFSKRAIYVKRKRNNPVQYPSLSQTAYETQFDWYLKSYADARAYLEGMEHVQKILDKKIMNYYCNYFVTRIRRSNRDHWKTTRFQTMRELASKWDKKMISKQKFYKKHLIRALLKNDLKKTIFFVNVHLGKKKLRKIFKNKKQLSIYLYRHVFTKMSIKEDYVMLETFLGRNYADSPKNIYEYLCEHYPGKYKFIWSVAHKTDIPYAHKTVKRFGLRYAYYLARSKYFVFNMRQPEWMRKRKDTVFLQTWHGTPLKKLCFDQEEVLSATPLYKQQVYKQGSKWDYLVSDNHFSTEAFRSAFLYDKEILELGYPRNDLLYRSDREKIADQIKTKLNLPKDKKVILYAPTWRDDEYYGKGKYKFALPMDIDRYQKELGDEYILLFRTHYFIADQLDLSNYQGFAYNVSKYNDITELYLISDVCITDYSSVFFDFANLKRPILFYMYDLEKYRDVLRGFYLDIEKEVPGPILLTDDEVISSIKNIDEVSKEYKDRYDAFWQRFCSLDDGNASKRIVEKVFDL